MAKKDAFVHHCQLPPDVDFAYTIIPGDTKTAKLRRAFLRCITIDINNIHARRIYKSTTALQRERARHLKGKHYVIHPFSTIRSAWNTVMIFVYTFAFFIIPIYVAFVSVSDERMISWRVCDLIQCILCWFDIIMNSLTGYLKGTEVEIVRWKVFFHYLVRYFIFDLSSSIPFEYIPYFNMSQCPYCELIACLRFTKFVRSLTYFKYVRDSFESLNVSFMILEAVLLFLLCFFVVHFFCGILYLVSFEVAEVDFRTWIIQEHVSQSYGLKEKYLCSFYRATSNVLNMGYGLTTPRCHTDQGLIIFVSCIGCVLMAAAIAKVLQWAYITYSSTALYDAMLQQLLSFTRYKQLSEPLQKRLIHYYEFRYQQTFFNEAEIFNTLSGQLRHEIIINSCWRLVENVSFFQNMPIALLTRIVVSLHLEFYLANDVIMKAGTTGDNMYFISAGTVAIYSPTGFEVCHLEDGAHFGEVALVMQSTRRVASVVAVESCELYRLQGSDFKRAIMPYPDLIARIERIAEERYERTGQLDERNRRAKRGNKTKHADTYRDAMKV